jgi:hypothetical protein
MFTVYKYYIIKVKLKTKPCSAYRIPAHQFSIGHDFNQVDDDDNRIQNVSKKHVLVQRNPLTAKAPGRTCNIKC